MKKKRENKPKVISFRTTEDAYLKVKTYMKETCLSIEFMLIGYMKKSFVRPIKNPVDRDYVFQLRKLGINLNQASRQLHQLIHLLNQHNIKNENRPLTLNFQKYIASLIDRIDNISNELAKKILQNDR